MSTATATTSSPAAQGVAQNRKKTSWAGIWSTVGIGFIVIYCLAPFY